MFFYKTFCFACGLFTYWHNLTSGLDIVKHDMTLQEDIGTANQADIVTIQEHETAVLPCSYNVAIDSKVIWKGPDSKLIAVDGKLTQSDRRFSVETRSSNDWALRINYVQQAEQGIYECIINSQPAVLKPVILVVQVPPVIENRFAVFETVYEGDDIELQCVSYGIPPPAVIWHFQSDKAGEKMKEIDIENDEYSGHVIERYLVTNMSEYSSGTYQCQVTNGVGTDVWRRFVIRYKPLPTFVDPEVKNVTADDYSTAVLPCAVKNLGSLKVVWKKYTSQISSGRSILWSDRFSVKHSTPEDWSLHIHPVSPWDEGTYTCELQEDSKPLKVKKVTLTTTV